MNQANTRRLAGYRNSLLPGELDERVNRVPAEAQLRFTSAFPGWEKVGKCRRREPYRIS